jgi:hypothetical protein
VPDVPIEQRRFTDREVREIIKKAVESTSSTDLVRSEGLSLEELKAIAGDVGIDPDRLEAAARAVVMGGAGGTKNKLFGGPIVLDFEEKVPAEFDPQDTPELLSMIRRVMGQQGEAEELHGSIEWSVKGDMGERYVTLAPRDGTTTIRGSANLSNAAILTYLPVGIVGAIAAVAGTIAALNNGNPVGLIFTLGLIPILYAIMRTVLGQLSKSQARKLQRVVLELARRIGSDEED